MRGKASGRDKSFYGTFARNVVTVRRYAYAPFSRKIAAFAPFRGENGPNVTRAFDAVTAFCAHKRSARVSRTFKEAK